MTTAAPTMNDNIRWYEFHRWLSPFARWQGSFVTPLTPQEIAWRLYPHFVAAPVPETTLLYNKLKPGLNRLFGHAPQMTDQERRLLAPNVDPSPSDSTHQSGLMYGSLHPRGFSIARYESDPVRFQARYHVTPTGTRIDAWFGWSWSLRTLYHIGFESLFLLTLLFLVESTQTELLRIFGFLVLI